MVKQQILIGLGLKKQNFRNRAIHYMLNRAGKAIGGALPQDQKTIMPVSRPPPKFGGAVARRPLKFNY